MDIALTSGNLGEVSNATRLNIRHLTNLKQPQDQSHRFPPCRHKPYSGRVSSPVETFRELLERKLTNGTVVQDENLKKLLMSWYYAGYYTGLFEGQQQAQQAPQP